ncbi:MAG: M23 family metallopeptidase [Acidimicrobiales bacterium]
MRTTPPRPLLIIAAAAALSLAGTSLPGAAVAQIPPAVTLPSGAASTTTTVVPPPSTTVAPTTVAPTTVVPTTGPETKIIPMPVDGGTPAPGRPAPGPAATTTVPTGDPKAATPSAPPPPSLSPGQVAEVLRSQQRSGASSTSALVEALRPLQNLGMTAEEALNLGMGQFPMLGVANWTDDWLDPRAGPPVHQHQGNDLFAAFDTPVRAPVDGVVRFEDAGLGGKGAFVTAPDGTYYYMAHLNSFNRDVGNGAAVKQGQIIGYNGDSGNAKGGAPHVHFEIHPRGGGAVDPKPILDAWVAAALARVPELIASFQPKVDAGGAPPSTDALGVPQILVTTGQTRRFSAPSLPVPNRERRTEDFNHAVLGPLTPTALASLLDP